MYTLYIYRVHSMYNVVFIHSHLNSFRHRGCDCADQPGIGNVEEIQEEKITVATSTDQPVV